MKTVGAFLKEARRKKKYSIAEVEEETRIKRGYISAIEEGKWGVLPDYTVVSGFVKNLASFLGLDRNQAVALLRRDYPVKKTQVDVKPKSELERRFKIGPRLTFLAGVLLIGAAVLSYLGFQYLKFIRPPVLVISEPKEDQVVKERDLKVRGRTSEGTVVRINNQPVTVDEDGNFETVIEVSKETKEIVVKAVSRSGKETQVNRKIMTELEQN